MNKPCLAKYDSDLKTSSKIFRDELRGNGEPSGQPGPPGRPHRAPLV